MKKWEQELKQLPTEANGRKATQEPTSTEIVLEFLRDEIYPRLKFAQNSFAKQELHAALHPASPEEISTKTSIVSISLPRQLVGTHYEYSLQFKREEGFEIGVELNGKHGHTTLGTFAIDRGPESPATLVEMYIEQFREQVR